MSRILILGGTTEARALCSLLAARSIEAEVSLAGRVPGTDYPLPVRSGGFGGAAGLARYLREARIRALLDATHPFAAAMPWNAAEAADGAGLPRAMLKRPPWLPGPGERWRGMPDLAAAAAALPAGARVFLATGAGSLPAFASCRDCRFLLRQMTPPGPLPDHVEVLVARPGATAAEEAALLRAHRITHLVAKNSGGPARAKLDAARDLGLEVLLVARPLLPPGRLFARPEAALDWIEGLA
ncbi:cobalt-precorrin-6A reductase [Poseidonocella sp. HB161398]|uniref:cobalt-precorrin-6A reductase n=1 Tax=Poseidonocella sp. HB161398 TaxID=2320855 RepID=UPI001109AF2A|nr:cobalt-precorrin-6A reductase [Poseidonocella sp. HB161398]